MSGQEIAVNRFEQETLLASVGHMMYEITVHAP